MINVFQVFEFHEGFFVLSEKFRQLGLGEHKIRVLGGADICKPVPDINCGFVGMFKHVALFAVRTAEAVGVDQRKGRRKLVAAEI